MKVNNKLLTCNFNRTSHFILYYTVNFYFNFYCKQGFYIWKLWPKYSKVL